MRLIRSLWVVVVDENGELTLRAGSPAYPRLADPIDRGQCLKPLLDQNPIDVLQVTAQIAPHQSGQVAHTIHEKCRLREVVLFGQE